MQQQLEKHVEEKNSGFVASLLPELEVGMTRLHYTGERNVFQLFVGKEVANGECVWIDTENHSSTYALADISGKRALEEVSIGRAFTPFQHHQLCTNIEEFIGKDTEIIALPAVNGLYEEGQIRTSEAEELLEEALEHVRDVAEKKDLKVILSNSSKADGKLEYLTGIHSQNSIDIDETVQGLKFSSDDFETLIYPGKNTLQTTLPFWMKKLGKNEGDFGSDSRKPQRKPGGEEDGKDEQYVPATP